VEAPSATRKPIAKGFRRENRLAKAPAMIKLDGPTKGIRFIRNEKTKTPTYPRAKRSSNKKATNPKTKIPSI